MWYILCNIKIHTICTVTYSWCQDSETLYTHRHTEVDKQKDSTIISPFNVQENHCVKHSSVNLQYNSVYWNERKTFFIKTNKASVTSTAIKWLLITSIRDSNSVRHDSIVLNIPKRHNTRTMHIIIHLNPHTWIHRAIVWPNTRRHLNGEELKREIKTFASSKYILYSK